MIVGLSFKIFYNYIFWYVLIQCFASSPSLHKRYRRANARKTRERLNNAAPLHTSADAVQTREKHENENR